MSTSNRTDVALLGLLASEPRSGYDIKKAIEEQLSHFWSESVGNIYPRLKRLHERGLLTKEVHTQQGRPDRSVYALTDAGHEALRGWFSQPTRPTPPRQELLLKVAFGRHAPPGVLVEQVRQYRARRAADIGQFEAIHAMLEQEAAGHPDLPYWLITLRAGIRAARAAVAWADDTIPVLEDL